MMSCFLNVVAVKLQSCEAVCCWMLSHTCNYNCSQQSESVKKAPVVVKTFALHRPNKCFFFAQGKLCATIRETNDILMCMIQKCYNCVARWCILMFWGNKEAVWLSLHGRNLSSCGYPNPNPNEENTKNVTYPSTCLGRKTITYWF